MRLRGLQFQAADPGPGKLKENGKRKENLLTTVWKIFLLFTCKASIWSNKGNSDVVTEFTHWQHCGSVVSNVASQQNSLWLKTCVSLHVQPMPLMWNILAKDTLKTETPWCCIYLFIEDKKVACVHWESIKSYLTSLKYLDGSLIPFV